MASLIKVGLENVKKALAKNNYKFFENGDYNVNIVSFRNSKTGHKITNQFDDVLTLSYKIGSKWYSHEWDVTVDPGKKSMLQFENVKGCAILVPGQYSGAYMVRLHQGKYEAVCQNPNKPVKVYRDKNKDGNYDFDPKTIDSGIFGINIHRSSANGESTIVDGWSAGCTVFKRVKDFNEFMTIINKAKDIHGNSFTYTLMETKDFE